MNANDLVLFSSWQVAPPGPRVLFGPIAPHRQTGHFPKEYKCRVCGKVYSQSSSLINHEVDKHGRKRQQRYVYSPGQEGGQFEPAWPRVSQMKESVSPRGRNTQAPLQREKPLPSQQNVACVFSQGINILPSQQDVTSVCSPESNVLPLQENVASVCSQGSSVQPSQRSYAGTQSQESDIAILQPNVSRVHSQGNDVPLLQQYASVQEQERDVLLGTTDHVTSQPQGSDV